MGVFNLPLRSQMQNALNAPNTWQRSVNDVIGHRHRFLALVGLGFLVGLLTFVAAAAAAPTPTPTSAAGSGPAEVCTTALADTIRNILVMIQFGGPLIGGVVGVGAMVVKPLVRGEDRKRKLKQLRDGGILWGVVAAPLSIAMLRFIVNSIVAGGSTCAF